MKTKRMMALVIAAIFAMTLVGEVMAATKTQSRTKTRTPTSTCVPRI